MRPPATRRFWLITLATVAGIVVTVLLGRWQLSRAAQKEAIHAAIEAQSQAAPLDTRALAGEADWSAFVHRRARLRGTWLAANTVYLDNRQMNGRPGFYVVTPFRLDEGGRVVLVQRGWIPRNFEDRTRLVPVQTPPGVVEITGRIGAPPSQLLALGQNAPAPPGEGASGIRQNLDLAAFRTETGLPLVQGSLVQTGAPSEGLLREWPEVATGVEKHYGYAAQWFSFGALMAILYVWFQFIAPRRRQRTGR